MSNEEVLEKICKSVETIENILRTIHKKELCKHLQLDKIPMSRFARASTKGIEQFAVHKCLDCGTPLTMKLEIKGQKK